MKLRVSVIAIILGSLSIFPVVRAETPVKLSENALPSTAPQPYELLIKMQNARKQMSYQFAFIDISNQGVQSLRYRHSFIDGKTFAQLLQIDGPRREVLQRGDVVSYYDQTAGIKPFSLPGKEIIDALPSVLYTDFAHIKAHYNFIALGTGRVTDRQCDIVRIVSDDGTRYSYVVWLDSETALPLQVELLGQKGDTIEQFRVTDVRMGEEVKTMFQPLRNITLPPVLSDLPQAHSVQLNWKPDWLPAGMRLTSQTRRQILGLNREAESQYYSDGLYDFTVNVTPEDTGSSRKSFSNGGRTLVMEVRNKKEISVVGMIPVATAQRIANSINLEPTS